MSSWKKRALLQKDVVFFEYVASALAQDENYVYVWDLDKTYLDTQFESLSGLYRTIIEKAFQKKNVPGTRSLVRALTVRGESHFPIYFVSASPPQMEERIHEKLQLDGVKPYGMFFKDNLKNLRPGRFRRLGHQVGFKLQALLRLRNQLGKNVQQILWGDDSESDAVIYSLYSDICAKRLPEKTLRQILSHYHVRGEQLEVILDLQSKIPEEDPVNRIYINLATDTDPDYYSKFGRRMLATYNSFQVALDLFQEGQLNEAQLQMIALDLLQNYGFTPEQLAKSFNDLVSRRVLSKESVERLLELLLEERYIPSKFQLSREPISGDELLKIRNQKVSRVADSWVPNFIDYMHDFR